MKTLIVYFSWSGNNELLAGLLKHEITCQVLKLEESQRRTGLTILLDILFKRSPKLKPYHRNIQEYDHLILIAPVWSGKIASPLRSFIQQERSHIKSYSFITVCSGVKGQKDKLSLELKRLTDVEPKIITELWINDLLPEEKKNKIRFTTGYNITETEFKEFRRQIVSFLRDYRRLTHEIFQ